MKSQKLQFVIGCYLLITSFCLAQNPSNISKIESLNKSYFNLVREHFYLQFNKSVYINTETIYFKGYVFDKTNEALSIETTNVHVDFYDVDGKKIESKLLYSFNGEFEGFFELDATLPSNFYYFQVYTNWSNNFSEDESSIFSVEIINPNLGRYSYTDTNPEINFHPEGGNLITGISNTVGISILDCRGNGVSVANGTIFNGKGEVITTFKTNDIGYGTCQIPNIKNEIYTAKFEINGNLISKNLPKSDSAGTALKVINYINESKTFVTIETTNEYKDKDKEHYLTVSQNNKIAVIGFNLANDKREITIADSLLYPGANTIRVLDQNLQQLNERIIYNNHQNKFSSSWNINKKSTDSIKIRATFLSNVKMSISVLPEETVTANTKNSITNNFYVNNYISNKLPNGNYYFTDVDRKKKYELDLFLLSQKSKYNWSNFSNEPTAKFTFNKGLTLKGKVNETLDDRSKYLIQMFAFAAGINETTTINEKNEFYFKNFIASDSLQVNFSLIKNGSKYKELVYFPQITSDEKPFNKPFKGIKTECLSLPANNTVAKIESEIPKLNDAIKLKEVKIETKIKTKESKRKSEYGNFNFKAKKITDDEYKAYRYIIPYIQAQGFDAGLNADYSVFIRGRTRTSLIRSNIPSVFIDDIQLFDFDILYNYSLEQVDEILINKNASAVQSQGFGVIKIYTKSEFKTNTTFVSKLKSFKIKNGFSYQKSFVLPDYAATNSEGFKNYGIVGWVPFVSDDQKSVTITIPNLNQKQITLQIEGISQDGKFISEIKTIDLE